MQDGSSMDAFEGDDHWLRRLVANASAAAVNGSAAVSGNGTAGNGTAAAAADDSAATAAAAAAPAPPDATDVAGIDGDAGWTMLIGGFLIFTGIFVCAVICVLRGTGTIPKNKIVRRVCMITDG
jgi:hypothetical protein